MARIFLVAFLFALFARVNSFVAPSHVSSSTALRLAVGEAAPDFELSTYDGKKVKLSSFKGKQPVIAFFYPADSTPGCTVEACTFEKKAPDFKRFNAKVVGISSGGPADKEKFVKVRAHEYTQKFLFQFPIL